MTIVFTIAGQYLGGFVYFKLTNIPLQYLEINSLYDSYLTYRYDELIRKYVMSGVAVSLIMAFLPIIMVITIAILSIKKEEIHGSARFAKKSEIKKSGILKKNSKYPLIVGKMGKDFVYLSGQLFLGVSAPTRSGKGVGVVVPNLLNYQDSIVNVDIKFENYVLTSGYRKSIGQEVYLFAPMGYQDASDIENKNLRSHRWNCFDYVRRSPLFRVSDLLVIAGALYPTGNGDKNDMWNELASKLFTGLCLWMLDTEDIYGKLPTLPYIYSLTSVDGGLAKWMKEEISKGYCSTECEHEFHNFINAAEETRASILSNLVAPLAILGDQVVARAVSGSDFDLRDLRKKRMTVYIGIPPPKLGVLPRLINLFFEQLINENTSTLPEHDPKLKYQCLLMLDEFTALGRVNQIVKSVGFTAGYNLRYVFIYQDKAQLEESKLYGKEGADILESNQGGKIIFPPKEVNKTAENLSKTLGTKTVSVKSKSRTYGKHASRSVSSPLQKRDLMMPHEIVALGNKLYKNTNIGEKIFYIKDNLSPLIMNKVIYFDEPIFIERLKQGKNYPIDVPVIASY